MKNLIVLFSLFLFISCGKKTINYYHGYVLNKKNEPIVNVKVEENNKVPLSTVTDSTGYFMLYKSPDWVSQLIFKKKGYKTDTVQTVWNRYSGSGKRFLNKIPDTIILHLSAE